MSDTGNKSTTPVDRRVGSRIRLRRKMVGMTQVSLGGHLGITSQQVQKYEKGINRIGASRLERIAHALGVSTSHFFEEGTGPSSPGPSLDRFLQMPESAALITAFMALEDSALRRQVVEIVRAVKVIGDTARRKTDGAVDGAAGKAVDGMLDGA